MGTNVENSFAARCARSNYYYYYYYYSNLAIHIIQIIGKQKALLALDQFNIDLDTRLIPWSPFCKSLAVAIGR
jgi:hypothetical protein